MQESSSLSEEQREAAVAFEIGWGALQLSSPGLIKKWARIYRNDGEDGLRPKSPGRPTSPPKAPTQPESELQRLRRENERLRAEVAFRAAPVDILLSPSPTPRP
jgi:transposase-like protein